MDTLLITRATPGDSRDLWLWRNDSTTRKMSIQSEEVSWDSHKFWFENSLRNQDRYFYVGLLAADNAKVGICRFDVDPVKNVAEVSINLNPTQRGKGFSQTLLSKAIQAFLSERQMDLVATIKKENTASIKCFTKCGFVLESEGDKFDRYRLQVRGVQASG